MDKEKSYSYRDLHVWQKGIDLVVAVYEITLSLPKEERYGLASQMQRAALSIPANIAEGRRRGTRKDYLHFLTIAYGSGAELETFFVILKRLPFGNGLDMSRAEALLDDVMRMLNRLRLALKPNNRTIEQPNNRITEQPNNRIIEQPNNRITQQPNNRICHHPNIH
jgi:four helix bundle protein